VDYSVDLSAGFGIHLESFPNGTHVLECNSDIMIGSRIYWMRINGFNIQGWVVVLRGIPFQDLAPQYWYRSWKYRS